MIDVEEQFQAAKSGDRSAFDRLIEHYREPICGFIGSQLGSRLRSRVESDDVLQEASLRAFRSLAKVDWRGDVAFRNWLFGIAMHVIQEHARRFLRWGEAEGLPEVPDDGTSPTKLVRRKERFERLEASLTRLSDEHQQVIRLVRIEGMPVREVAERMERSEKATYQLLWRATHKLKEIFGDTASLHLPDRRIGDDPSL